MKIRNWSKFQHFKDRRPPWVKLYRDILDDIEWHRLDGDSAKHLVMLWLLASEGDEGELPSIDEIAFRLRITEKQAKTTVSKLSHWVIQDDITAISPRYQSDRPETETETEKEAETEGAPRQNGDAKKTRKPDLLFEAIANACGIEWKALTKNERGALNNAAAQLRDINATPEDVQARAAKYRQKWPGIDLTPMALVNNWNTVIAAPEQSACQVPQLKPPPHMTEDEYDGLDRQGKLAAWKRWGEIWDKRRQGDAAA
jgi:hypothetical protein